MSDLIIDNHVIKKDISAILDKIKSQITNGKLRTIKYSGDNVIITCPHHSDGLEKNPSCNIYIGDSDKLTFGKTHCFTCGFVGPLYHFVGECFDRDDYFGKEWLKKYFTERIIENNFTDFDRIDLSESGSKPVTKKYLNEKILDKFQSWHPYMAKRKLSKEICERFQVKYDPETESIVFPVRDLNDKLLFLTRRSVNTKKFIIDADVEKPVYLLNYILKNKIKEIYVCESQINALTLFSWGYPAVALFGTGTSYQYDILNNTDILTYHLCFDGDQAGHSGVDRFIRNIKNTCFVDIVEIPRGKDVNDLSKEQFEKLNIIDSYYFK